MAKNKPADYSHFAALNMLVDGGWLSILNGVDLAVWTVYQRHADTEGISFPGPKRIAKAVGHCNTRHLRDARTRLIAWGLLDIVTPGGGRHPMKVRVMLPPTPPLNGHSPKRARQAGPKPAHQAAPIRAPQPAPIPGNEGLSSRANEETSSNSSGCAAVAAADLPLKERKTKAGRDDRQQAAWEALRAAGIGEPSRSELATQVPGLTAAAVNAIHAAQSADTGAGALVLAIRADGEDVARGLSEAERQAREAEVERGALRRRRESEVDALDREYAADAGRHDAMYQELEDAKRRQSPMERICLSYAALRYFSTHNLMEIGDGEALKDLPMNAAKMMVLKLARTEGAATA